MRKQRYLLLIGLIGLLLFVSVNPATATEVWSDNFDDGNYDGWTKHDPDLAHLALDFIVEDGAVYAYDDSTCAWEWLSHPSNVTEGHWSFDFYQPADEAGPVDFFFMANGTNWEALEAYDIHITCFDSNPPIIGLYYWDGSFNGDYTNLIYYVHNVQINGTWAHFDVTCDSSGELKIYLDDDLILEYSGVTFDDCEVFMFGVGQYIVGEWTGFGMDNVEVDDDATWVPATPMTTTTTTPPESTTPTSTDGGDMTPMLIIAGGGIAVLVVIVIIVKMRGS